MIDIHTHILPGLDDGAPDWDQAIALAKAAAAEGIQKIIATPHHANGAYLNPADKVREAVARMNERLERERVPIEVLPGQEIRVHDDMLDAWTRGELLTLADSQYILLELPSSRIPSRMFDWIHELRLLGLHPIIAHPERNAEIIKHPERLKALIEAGCYAQVTTHSLLGAFGARVEEAAWSLCKQGLIHVVSSDAHHVDLRGFKLSGAYELITHNIGDKVSEYYRLNASTILDNIPISLNSLPKVNVKWWRKLSIFSH